MAEQTIRPFLKWAGGKTQLLDELRRFKPPRFNCYLEPFVGAGAFLFDLEHLPSKINDLNADLINVYTAVKDDVDAVIDALEKYKNEEEFYYEIRSLDKHDLAKIERAARFIYLNKTCYNGLYRVNKKGEFNVPFGRRKNPKIVDSPLLYAVSDFLQDVDIHNMDFEEFSTGHAAEGDFVYFDPPYVPLSEYSDFKRYTSEQFYEDDHIRLRDTANLLRDRECFVLLSNSNTELVRDLYDDFHIYEVYARRYINKDGAGRNKIKELLISSHKRTDLDTWF